MYTTSPVMTTDTQSIHYQRQQCIWGPNELNVLVEKLQTVGGFDLNDQRIIYISFLRTDIVYIYLQQLNISNEIILYFLDLYAFYMDFKSYKVLEYGMTSLLELKRGV